MTEMLYGSRFLEGIDLTDWSGGSRYVDEADAFDTVIEYIPRHLRAASLSRELQEALDAAFAPEDELQPATLPLPEPVPTPVAEFEVAGPEVTNPDLIVPETIEYPAVLPDPALLEPAIPDTFFREAVVATPEPVIAPEPVIVPEPVFVLPAPATRVTLPVPEHTPVSPTPFPEQELREARRHVETPQPHARIGRRRIRPLKVDVSRLMVPSVTQIANG